jgi:helicase
LDIRDLPIPDSAKEIIIDSGISTLYPPQEEAIKAGALDGENLVLASPTASGKTLVAQLCAIKHIFDFGGKILYMTPLRALASEKFEEFKVFTKLRKPDRHKVKIAISTGDYDSSDSWLSRYDIIVVTNEKCDSLIRHRSGWLSAVTLVVADEVHILNDSDRGPTLEVTLTRLMEMKPEAQMLALSATIRNVTEVAEWLKAKYIATEWRPVKLVEGVYLDGECQFNDGSSIKVDRCVSPAIDLAYQVIRQGGQALIFAETRARAVSHAKSASRVIEKELSRPERRALITISEKIMSTGERTRLNELLANLIRSGVAFHHAGLAPQPRKIVEDSFREGKIKLVSATPTLAAGVNLPARRVIIGSYQRYDTGFGRSPISVLEYKQMAGRAGRPKYDRIGEAILIAQTADEYEYLMQSYITAKPERIWSKLAVEGVLRSHVLSSIATGFINSERGLNEFFCKTFYASQYGTETINALVVKALRYLYKEGMIDYTRDKLEATEFGKRVSELYIDPVSAVIIRDGLKMDAKLTEFSLLHMVCHTPDASPKCYPRSREIDELAVYADLHSEEFLVPTPRIEDEIEYQTFLGEVKSALILDAWINEVSEDEIIERFNFETGDLYRLTDSVVWLLYATAELSRLFGHDRLLNKILEIKERVKKGIKAELLSIARIEGIGRVRGRMLFNAGFTSLKALREASPEQLMAVPTLGLNVVKRIKERVGGFLKAEEWEALKRKEGWEQRSIVDY